MKLRLFPILVATFLLGGAELAAKASSNFAYLKCDGKVVDAMLIDKQNNKRTSTLIGVETSFAIKLDEENSRFNPCPIDAVCPWIEEVSFGANKIKWEDKYRSKPNSPWPSLKEESLIIDRNSGQYSWSSEFDNPQRRTFQLQKGQCKKASPRLF